MLIEPSWNKFGPLLCTRVNSLSIDTIVSWNLTPYHSIRIYDVSAALAKTSVVETLACLCHSQKCNDHINRQSYVTNCKL